MVDRMALMQHVGHHVCDRESPEETGQETRTSRVRRPFKAQFTCEGLKQLWLADITQHRTRVGKLYLCALKDVVSRRIIGYSISDRGSQLRRRKLSHALRFRELAGPLGRVSAAGDNAAMESIFALLQNNVLNLQSWVTREQLRPGV